jgi:hypothetical protein
LKPHEKKLHGWSHVALNSMMTEIACASAPDHPPSSVPASSPTYDDKPELDQIEVAKPTFLHSPPDSNNAAKSEGSDSELSDLEDDAILDGDGLDAPPKVEDDIGEIVPDHYSGTVPVFKPTMHQFKDFKIFVGCKRPLSIVG